MNTEKKFEQLGKTWYVKILHKISWSCNWTIAVLLKLTPLIYTAVKHGIVYKWRKYAESAAIIALKPIPQLREKKSERKFQKYI